MEEGRLEVESHFPVLDSPVGERAIRPTVQNPHWIESQDCFKCAGS